MADGGEVVVYNIPFAPALHTVMGENRPGLNGRAEGREGRENREKYTLE